ncbi:MAG: glycine cleavage system aminomethyltransferase GcvT [Candidatus Delongbacteria bacterium]|nr:glycine cleavage system aminomethyltransferase GcvT [Candidatus Delongbacteria bacterium]
MSIKSTALLSVHEKLGARIVDFAGYRMPLQYTSILDEHQAVRQAAGVFDVSHMGEFFVSGTGVRAFLDSVTVNNVARLKHGQIHYSAMMTPQGGIVDDLLVYCQDDEHFMLVVNASNRDKDLAWLKSHCPAGITIDDQSDDWSLLAVQGPLAWPLIVGLSDEPGLDEVPYYWFRHGHLRGIPAIISRTGYTGERGFELYVRNEHAVALWELLFREGEAIGLKPIGLGARDTLRLEMKFALYGNDIDDTTSTIEANLGWITKARKGDFQGSEVVKRHLAEGAPRLLVGFELVEKGIARHGHSCWSGDQEVGVVTSGAMSPSLGRPIGMAYLPPALAAEGSEFQVEIRGRRLAARVVPTPFYNPEVPCK